MPKFLSLTQCQTLTTAKRLQSDYDRLEQYRQDVARRDLDDASRAATRASETCLRIARKLKVNCG